MQPATQAGALAGILPVQRPALNPLSYISQGAPYFLRCHRLCRVFGDCYLQLEFSYWVASNLPQKVICGLGKYFYMAYNETLKIFWMFS